MPSLNNFSGLAALLPEEERDKLVNLGKIQRRVYCEIAFLEKIQFLLERPVNPMEMTESDLQIKALFDILVEFDLYIDAPKECIDRLANCLYKEVQGVDRILWYVQNRKLGNNRSVKMRGADLFVSIESIDERSAPEVFNALFMTAKSPDVCKQVSNSYGVAIMQFDEKDNFVNPTKLLNNSWLELQIKKRDKAVNNWDFLEKASFQTNSIIFVDAYLLKNEKSITLNVLPILDKLMPYGHLKIPFNITFVTNDKDKENELSVMDALIFLKENVKQLNRDYEIAINIYDMRGKEHNRWVIANNQYIKCEAGFDLIYEDEKRRKLYSKSTNIHASCIFSNPCDRKDYETLCKRIIGYKKNKEDWYYNAENRLLC